MKTAILSTSKETPFPIVSHKKCPIEFDNDPLVTGEGLDPNMTDEEYFTLVRKAVQEAMQSGRVPDCTVEQKLREIHVRCGFE